MGNAMSSTNHGFGQSRPNAGSANLEAGKDILLKFGRNALDGVKGKERELEVLMHILSFMTPFVIPDRLPYRTSYHWMGRSLAKPSVSVFNMSEGNGMERKRGEVQHVKKDGKAAKEKYVMSTTSNPITVEASHPNARPTLIVSEENQRKIETIGDNDEQKDSRVEGGASVDAPEVNEDLRPFGPHYWGEEKEKLRMKYRKEAYRRKARADINANLKSMTKCSLRAPLYPSRPYGLSKKMKGHRRHVWDLILAHVNDLNTMVKLRNVCIMFRELLDGKYVATRLPDVIRICFERKIIPWSPVARMEVSNWVKTLANLRALSKATKASVDVLFDRGLLPPQWFSFHYPHYRMEFFKVPTLTFGVLDIEQARLQWALDTLGKWESFKDSFPRAIMFSEYRPDRHPFPVDDLEDLRNAFEKCLEKIGHRIISFHYTTRENPANVYNNLRRWVAHMPNLKDLTVLNLLLPAPQMNHPENAEVEAFPKCPNLKRYAGGPHGFGFPFINEIIKANSTIEEILLAKSSSSTELEAGSITLALDSLRLRKLKCTCTPTISFLEHRFKWALQLTVLILWDTDISGDQNIPSDKLFDFISSFENLTNLLVSSTRICNTGGSLNLPKLGEFAWKVVPEFKSLEFLKPVESLRKLLLDLSSFPKEFRETEKVMQYLEEWNVPSFFPALKEIKVKNEPGVGVINYRIVWKP